MEADKIVLYIIFALHIWVAQTEYFLQCQPLLCLVYACAIDCVMQSHKILCCQMATRHVCCLLQVWFLNFAMCCYGNITKSHPMSREDGVSIIGNYLNEICSPYITIHDS